VAMRHTISSTLALMASLLPTVLSASQNCTDDAMLVFDGSGSMAEIGFNLLEEPRIFEARRAIHDAIPAIAAVRRVGLVIYGPGKTFACGNIDMRFGPRRAAAAPIIDAVDRIEPEGETPLTEAVEEAARVLDYRSRPGAIVLLTDGKETCGGQPCQLAAELAADAHDLTIHVIGFKVRGEHFGWSQENGLGYSRTVTVAKCLAEATGGTYSSTETLDELKDALTRSLGCQLIGQSTVTPSQRLTPAHEISTRAAPLPG